MDDNKPLKEFWVRLVHHENDEYNELWVTKDKKYLARHTFSREGIWYSVGDPHGFCELNAPLPEHFIFHVCDAKFHELFVSVNGDGKDFPCLRFICQDEWGKYRKTLPHWQGEESVDIESQAGWATSSISLQSWLATFKDPELYGDLADDYDENWGGCYETLQEDVLTTFQYLGATYQITKQKQRHTVCHVEWEKYYVAGQFVGAQYDPSNHGTMYAGNVAVDMVMDALKQIYGSVSKLSSIQLRDGEYSERCMTLYYAANHGLLNCNYRREHVDLVIENERLRHSFFTSREIMRAQFPGYMPDYPAL